MKNYLSSIHKFRPNKHKDEGKCYQQWCWILNFKSDRACLLLDMCTDRGCITNTDHARFVPGTHSVHGSRCLHLNLLGMHPATATAANIRQAAGSKSLALRRGRLSRHRPNCRTRAVAAVAARFRTTRRHSPVQLISCQVMISSLRTDLCQADDLDVDQNLTKKFSPKTFKLWIAISSLYGYFGTA